MKREIYWLFKAALALAGSLTLGVSLWTYHANKPIPTTYNPVKQQVEESIGFYSDYDAGESASLQHIAAQMRRCPQALHYFAHFSAGWLDGQGYIMTYDRNAKQLIRGDEFCGCGGGYENVTDKMIQEVAAKHGGMSDFEKLGGVSYP